jgi:hypothetical protein
VKLWWPGKNAKRNAYRTVIEKLRYVVLDEHGEPEATLSDDARMRLGHLLMWTTSQLWRIALSEHGCGGVNRDGSYPCVRCDEQSGRRAGVLWRALDPEIAAKVALYD